MLTKKIIERLYDAANSQRWNDHLRPPQGFTELDKQAHKMIIAYVLAKYEEDRGQQINWRQLIEGGIFEFFHRMVVTDIKPPVYYELMRENGREIDEWVIGQLKETLEDSSRKFSAAFARYFSGQGPASLEKRILKAAHYLATNWEFRIIYQMNKDIVVGIEDTKNEILSQIEDHYDLIGVQKVSLEGKTQKFIDLVGQLRFQKRWAQSPRIPETSVMGHMLIVAIFAYFCTLEIKGSDERLVNNYLCGLFHDLPEVLTRDIISPVKRSVDTFEEKIKSIEHSYIQEKIYPLIPPAWQSELNYFVQDEFATRVVKEGQRLELDEFQVPGQYDLPGYKPVDGRLLKCCDNLAALVEAVISYKHGVFSQALLNGTEKIYGNISGREDYRDGATGIDFQKLMDEFLVGEIIQRAQKSKVSFFS